MPCHVHHTHRSAHARCAASLQLCHSDSEFIGAGAPQRWGRNRSAYSRYVSGVVLFQDEGAAYVPGTERFFVYVRGDIVAYLQTEKKARQLHVEKHLGSLHTPTSHSKSHSPRPTLQNSHNLAQPRVAGDATATAACHHPGPCRQTTRTAAPGHHQPRRRRAPTSSRPQAQAGRGHQEKVFLCLPLQTKGVAAADC